MRATITQHLDHVLKHLYINPLEKCNLKCAICYTRKDSPILTNEAIQKFVDRYKKATPLETITFCGGEVFTLPHFPDLVNTLTAQGIFVQTITNGTIDRLKEFRDPNSVNLIVSLDGLQEYHDENRGEGNFIKSIHFLQKAIALGFHTEIFSIVTHQNYQYIDVLEAYLRTNLKNDIVVTYHPRKPPLYLQHHPKDNIVGKTEGFDFLTDEEMIGLMKHRNTFPPKELGCYQIALVSDGRVFGCCEGVTPIGKIDDAIETLTNNLRQRLVEWEKTKTLKHCLGCSSPEFICGIKRYLAAM